MTQMSGSGQFDSPAGVMSDQLAPASSVHSKRSPTTAQPSATDNRPIELTLRSQGIMVGVGRAGWGVGLGVGLGGSSAGVDESAKLVADDSVVDMLVVRIGVAVAGTAGLPAGAGRQAVRTIRPSRTIARDCGSGFTMAVTGPTSARVPARSRRHRWSSPAPVRHPAGNSTPCRRPPPTRSDRRRSSATGASSRCA